MLRQEIEKILDRYKGFKIYERNAEDIVDEVCDLIGKAAEGMNEVKNPIDYMTRPVENNAFSYGACKQLEKDRSDWQKELGK